MSFFLCWGVKLAIKVTVAAAIWAFFSKAWACSTFGWLVLAVHKAHLETLATELGEEATEVAAAWLSIGKQPMKMVQFAYCVLPWPFALPLCCRGVERA